MAGNRHRSLLSIICVADVLHILQVDKGWFPELVRLSCKRACICGRATWEDIRHIYSTEYWVGSVNEGDVLRTLAIRKMTRYLRWLGHDRQVMPSLNCALTAPIMSELSKGDTGTDRGPNPTQQRPISASWSQQWFESGPISSRHWQWWLLDGLPIILKS